MAYIDLEYVTQNNPCPHGVQFKGVFGPRSIGKTHGVIKYLYKNLNDGEAIMILRRNNLELNFQPFVNKYGAAFGKSWDIDGNMIRENRDKVIMYFSALSLAERNKNNNFDSPYVKHIIVDEVFAEKPNKNEYQQLETWITTVSRRTGVQFEPITVWLLGNSDYGHSPILEALGVYRFNGVKQKTDNGVYLFSNMESPAHVINVKSPFIRDIEISPENKPILDWTFAKQAYAMYDCGPHLYIKNVEKATQPYDMNVRAMILKYGLRKVGIPRVFVENYDCLRFIEDPALKFTI